MVERTLDKYFRTSNLMISPKFDSFLVVSIGTKRSCPANKKPGLNNLVTLSPFDKCRLMKLLLTGQTTYFETNEWLHVYRRDLHAVSRT
jgi:hypothetical protein